MDLVSLLDTQVTVTPIILPIMEVGDMEATTIPGAPTDMEDIILTMEVPTGPDTTMVIITVTITDTTELQLHTDTVIWIAGIITDMDHHQTPPTTDPKGLPITIPGTGAERPIPRVPAHPPRGMARVVSAAQHNEALRRVQAQHSVMQGPYPHHLQMHSVTLQEPMQH